MGLLPTFFLLLVLYYIRPQRIFIHYSRENNNVQFQVYLILWPWKLRLRLTRPGSEGRGLDMERIKNIARIGKPYRKRLIWHKFKLRIDLGLEDPALTGMAAGGGWALEGIILPRLFKYFRFLAVPEIKINPDFQESGLKVDWEGEITGPLLFWLKLWSLFKRSRRF